MKMLDKRNIPHHYATLCIFSKIDKIIKQHYVYTCVVTIVCIVSRQLCKPHHYSDDMLSEYLFGLHKSDFILNYGFLTCAVELQK